MTEQTSPSRRAGLRDEIAEAIWERQNPGRRYADCEHPWQADAEADADAVLPVLYRAWPWLRAEAEEATVPPEPATDQPALTDAERTMLTYALDQAQERIWSEDGFTDEDQAAVTSLRRLAAASAVVVRRATDETPGEAGRTVAYRSNGGSLLRCIAHAPEWAAILCGDFHPVTSDDLPDGGLCTMPDCGVDVLIPQQPKEARP